MRPKLPVFCHVQHSYICTAQGLPSFWCIVSFHTLSLLCHRAGEASSLAPSSLIMPSPSPSATVSVDTGRSLEVLVSVSHTLLTTPNPPTLHVRIRIEQVDWNYPSCLILQGNSAPGSHAFSQTMIVIIASAGTAVAAITICKSVCMHTKKQHQ